MLFRSPEGEFVFVPLLDVRLSAGHGVEQVEIYSDETRPLAFRADWMRQMRLKLGRLLAMWAKGDSMEPRIQDGDALVVDQAQTQVVDGGVFALWYEGGERVKRLYRLPGGRLRITSDNPSYGPIELSAEETELVRIIGRHLFRFFVDEPYFHFHRTRIRRVLIFCFFFRVLRFVFHIIVHKFQNQAVAIILNRTNILKDLSNSFFQKPFERLCLHRN